MRGRLLGSLFMCFVLAIGVTGAGACASADGELKGGAPRDFDAALPEPPPPTEPTFAEAAPNTWRGLYRDFFGRRAQSSCAGTGLCHGSPTQAGARDSTFVCANVEDCWVSLRTAKYPNPKKLDGALVEESAIAQPDSAVIFKVIRYLTPENVQVVNLGMPQVPSDFYFKSEDIVRMKAWIAAGAKND